MVLYEALKYIPDDASRLRKSVKCENELIDFSLQNTNNGSLRSHLASSRKRIHCVEFGRRDSVVYLLMCIDAKQIRDTPASRVVFTYLLMVSLDEWTVTAISPYQQLVPIEKNR